MEDAAAGEGAAVGGSIFLRVSSALWSTEPHEMKLQCQNPDRISHLPQDIIETILSLIPIEDALRTSILSKKWRYCWTGMPKLAFDVVQRSPPDDEEFIKRKHVNAIFHVLLLHRAPILEFSLSVVGLEFFREIDRMILHLSMNNNNVKKFSFGLYQTNGYLLPCSFFSLQKLEHLDLTLCAIELPLMFNGFSMLKSLCLHGVYISIEMLFVFLSKCPLLEKVTLIDLKLTDFELVELFNYLPSVQVLTISHLDMKDLDAGGMPHKLPISLVHLRTLAISVCYLHLPTVLCAISSCPNLEKIKVEMYGIFRWPFLEISTKPLDPQDYSGLKLDHLKEMEITSFHNYPLEMEFVKLIMAKSPLLKKARIELHSHVSVDNENKMLQDMLQLPFPRASPAPSLIVERPKK